ncbi:hypothetical protein [Pectobacterium brasiliense]|uniref:hypothetical protein n=1 Tax=Pectobacterium brasiliense TaxID=180957 RepID=UPI003D9ACF9F
MVGKVNDLHQLLPKLAKSQWRMSMREVNSYLNKIDIFFRRDDIKIEYGENKFYCIEQVEGNEDLEMEEYVLKMQRISHDTNYNLFLKSSSVMVYSAFESSLHSVAQLVSDLTRAKKIVKNHEPINKSFHGGIGISVAYLIDVHNLDWNGLEAMWTRIESFRFVRNNIVHNGGEVGVSAFERFDKIAAEECGLSRNNEIISIELFYITQIFDIMTYFLDELCRRLDGINFKITIKDSKIS